MKRTYVLEGLGCANCAAKMERRICQLPQVSHAAVHFATTTLVFEADAGADLDAIAADAAAIIHDIEPDVVVREHTPTAMAGEMGTTSAASAASVAATANATVAASATVLAGAMGWRDRLAALSAEGIPLLAASVFVLLAAQIFVLPAAVSRVLFITAWLMAGGKVLWRALRNIAKGQVFDENFLMALATVGAVAIGEYPEAVAVMLFYRTGELLENRALSQSRRSVQALLDIRPDYANLQTATGLVRAAPSDVTPGSIIVIRPGERVPLDGIVRDGRSALDTSAITGEAVPRDVAPSETVLSGTINLDGLLTVETTRSYGESTVARILDLVENAASHKAKTEAFITRFARWYTPTVVAIAAALAFLVPLAVPGAVFSEWLYRGLIFLVVSCPCALVISIPLSYFGGIGGASRAGILIKGSNFLEALARVDTVVFDKTGTLTRGSFAVQAVEPAAPNSREQLLALAARGECHSSHPIARAIMAAVPAEPDLEAIESFENLPGLGTRTRAAGREILAGSARLMAQAGIDQSMPGPTAGCQATVGTRVHIAVDRRYAGAILVADTVKPDAADAIRLLRNQGIRHIAMLTGDHPASACAIAEPLGITEIHSELLPQDKVALFDQLERRRSGSGSGNIVYVGDGINDAPVLARADIGIAMGGLGSDAAIEAADAVIMTDEPVKVAAAIAIARRTRAIVWQNIVFALGIKLLVLILGAAGHATMWEAVFADIGVTLIAVFNAMRLLRSADTSASPSVQLLSKHRTRREPATRDTVSFT